LRHLLLCQVQEEEEEDLVLCKMKAEKIK
jgi:hypothetical protein